MSQQMDLPNRTSNALATAVPTTVRYAFWLACAAAILSLLAPAVHLVQAAVNDVPPDVLATYRHDSPQATPEAIKTTVVFGQIVTLGVYLVVAAILVFLARKMKAGTNWARWTTAVLLVIGAAQWSTRALGSPLDILVKVVLVVCALAAIVCMFIPASRPHFSNNS